MSYANTHGWYARLYVDGWMVAGYGLGVKADQDQSKRIG